MELGSQRSWRTPLIALTRIGATPGDTHEEALRKEVLVLAAVIITSLSIVWVVSYWLLGLYLAAVIPFTYQVVSIINLTVFAKTKRYRIFRASELWLSLALPFLLQLSLGGFAASSGV
jgi:adenylate cyclase